MNLLRRLFPGPPRPVVDEWTPPAYRPEPTQDFDPTFFDNTLKPFSELSEATINIFYKRSQKVVLIIPGWSSDGRKDKYVQIINQILQGGSAVVLMNHPAYGDAGDKILTQTHLTMKYILENLESINSTSPDKVNISILGSSGGAGAAFAIASRYPQVHDILAVSPTYDVGQGPIETGLSNFQGNITIVRGDQDFALCPPDTAKVLAHKAKEVAVSITTHVVPGADHSFTQPGNVGTLLEIVKTEFGDKEV